MAGGVGRITNYEGRKRVTALPTTLLPRLEIFPSRVRLR